MATTCRIVGSGLFGDQTRLRHRALRAGQVVTLVRDSRNDYDEWAIVVMIDTNVGPRPVGFIPADKAVLLAPEMDRGQEYDAKVVVGYAAGQVPKISIKKRRGKK